MTADKPTGDLRDCPAVDADGRVAFAMLAHSPGAMAGEPADSHTDPATEH